MNKRNFKIRHQINIFKLGGYFANKTLYSFCKKSANLPAILSLSLFMNMGVASSKCEKVAQNEKNCNVKITVTTLDNQKINVALSNASNKSRSPISADERSVVLNEDDCDNVSVDLQGSMNIESDSNVLRGKTIKEYDLGVLNKNGTYAFDGYKAESFKHRKRYTKTKTFEFIQNAATTPMQNYKKGLKRMVKNGVESDRNMTVDEIRTNTPDGDEQIDDIFRVCVTTREKSTNSSICDRLSKPHYMENIETTCKQMTNMQRTMDRRIKKTFYENATLSKDFQSKFSVFTIKPPPGSRNGRKPVKPKTNATIIDSDRRSLCSNKEAKDTKSLQRSGYSSSIRNDRSLVILNKHVFDVFLIAKQSSMSKMMVPKKIAPSCGPFQSKGYCSHFKIMPKRKRLAVAKNGEPSKCKKYVKTSEIGSSSKKMMGSVHDSMLRGESESIGYGVAERADNIHNLKSKWLWHDTFMFDSNTNLDDIIFNHLNKTTENECMMTDKVRSFLLYIEYLKHFSGEKLLKLITESAILDNGMDYESAMYEIDEKISNSRYRQDMRPPSSDSDADRVKRTEHIVSELCASVSDDEVGYVTGKNCDNDGDGDLNFEEFLGSPKKRDVKCFEYLLPITELKISFKELYVNDLSKENKHRRKFMSKFVFGVDFDLNKTNDVDVSSSKCAYLNMLSIMGTGSKLETNGKSQRNNRKDDFYSDSYMSASLMDKYRIIKFVVCKATSYKRMDASFYLPLDSSKYFENYQFDVKNYDVLYYSRFYRCDKMFTLGFFDLDADDYDFVYSTKIVHRKDRKRTVDIDSFASATALEKLNECRRDRDADTCEAVEEIASESMTTGDVEEMITMTDLFSSQEYGGVVDIESFILNLKHHTGNNNVLWNQIKHFELGRQERLSMLLDSTEKNGVLYNFYKYSTDRPGLESKINESGRLILSRYQ